MDNFDPAAFRLQAIKVGLVTQEQFDEVYEELDVRDPPLPDVLRLLERKAYLTPWQSGKLLKGDADGFFLGGYRILYKIASGSFGRVFRAADPGSGRVVAIKVLRRRWSENPERIELFEREGKVGLKLKHDNIVEVLAVNKDPATSQYYIVMEFVEGSNLRERIRAQGRLDLDQALKLTEDAAAGLAYAYSRGVTHRDVKLTNILISTQGTAKLVDFGLAQFYAGSNREDERYRMERTVDYAGLERATGVKPGDVRSDIFFLGCVLFEMVTGRSPIELTKDRNARQAALRFQQVPALPFEEVRAPASVFSLVDTMLSLDPGQRFQTPSQLLDAVRGARRDVEGRAAGAAQRSVYVVEGDEGLQERLRAGFKEAGYRVMVASDPTRALERYRQQPFDALVVDARTAGEDGRLVFQHILGEAAHRQLPCVGILMLGKDQADWAERIPPTKNSVVLVRPGNFKQLRDALEELFGAIKEGEK
jgi:CheY-like chemotaxis protein